MTNFDSRLRRIEQAMGVNATGRRPVVLTDDAAPLPSLPHDGREVLVIRLGGPALGV